MCLPRKAGLEKWESAARKPVLTVRFSERAVGAETAPALPLQVGCHLSTKKVVAKVLDLQSVEVAAGAEALFFI